MDTLWLRISAPFAAFRWLQAGVYRATSPTIPPSAAWGLVLNLANIETRGDATGVTTLIRDDAPALCLAVGMSEPAEVSTLYQQLHSYPVNQSKSGTSHQYRAGARDAKYHIAPVKREVLCGFEAVLGVKAPTGIRERVEAGLRGAFNQERYGLPFAGDNNLLFDRIEVVEVPPSARWYTLMDPDSPPVKGACRLTTRINRADASDTEMPLFFPSQMSNSPPDKAWVWVPRCPSECL